MIDKQQKYEIVNRIVESKEFKKSEVFKKLLTFLLECSIEGNTPKEYTIATEVFKKEASFDPSTDTTVRVYVYKLRKQLEYYYKTEARHDKIRVVIPKGSYEISFVSKNKRARGKNKYLVLSLVLAGYIIVSHLLFVLKPWSKFITSDLSKSWFWSTYFEHGKHQLVVLGDHFFYFDFNTRTLLRQDDINSPEEFYIYRTTLDSTAILGILPYTLFPRNSVWPFQHFLSRLLVQKEYEIKAASKMSADNVNDYDILFVGSFHTLGMLKATFRNSHFQFKVFPNTLKITDGEKVDIIHENGNPTVYHTDYGIMRKIPGPDNNCIYIFTGFHETSTIGIAQYFTDPEKLEELKSILKKKFGHVPEYFEMVFKATGYNRITYSTEILSIFELSAEEHFW